MTGRRIQKKPPKSQLCSTVTDGKTVGVSGGLGGVSGPTGTIELVLNYNTGQVSAFASGGMEIGWNAGASSSAFTGYIYGLGNSNANYSGGFSTVFGSAVVGGFVAHSSGGLTNGPTGLLPSGGVKVFGASIGASLIDTPTWGVAATNYTQPLTLGPLGSILAFAEDPSSLAMLIVKQFCNKK